MGRELDEACARAMGWILSGDPDPEGKGRDVIQLLKIPAFSTDPAAARILEDEIERRGLCDRYAMAVLAQKETSDYIEGDEWFLLRATPEQRARAFLQAIEVANRS